ncbi:MAG: metal-sulfur cluster assembly factor [Gammaproteobacteria bacterium]
MNADTPALPDSEAVEAALRTVNDPEVGINVVDLGLVYAVDVAPGRVSVDLTMTTPACPLGGMILDDARRALEAATPDGTRIEVRLVWDPPWGPERMSDAARRHLGWQ